MNNFLLFQNINDEQIKKSKLIKTDNYECMAVTTRGFQNKDNQDCMAASQYPNNENLFMMVMADGISQGEYGDIAAKDVVKQLRDCFCKLSHIYINSPMMLEGKISDVMKKLNDDLYDSKAKASCALAVIGKKETLIANIGNTRCYCINDNIELQTIDDLKWNDYNDWEKIAPDGVKYLVGKDYLSKAIGLEESNKRHYFPNITTIDNNSYDKLVLTTHGLTDMLDSEDINFILNNYDLNEALDLLMLETLYSDPKKLPDEINEHFSNYESMFSKRIIPGNANASALIYQKRKNS